MGRRAGVSHNEARLRQHLAHALQQALGSDRGASAEAARKAGITRQALSLYLKMKATPGSETLRRLCSALSLRLDIEGAVVTGQPTESDPLGAQAVPEQMSLFRAISSVDQSQLRVEVLSRGSQSMDLKVSIDFGDPREATPGGSMRTGPPMAGSKA